MGKLLALVAGPYGTVIMYAVIALVAAGAYGGFVMHERGIGDARTKAIWEPKFNAEKGAKETAELANTSLQGDLDKLRALVKESRDKFAQIQADDIKRLEAARLIIAAANAKLAGYPNEIARLKAIASSKQPITETDCAEADAIISDVLARRMRDAGIATPDRVVGPDDGGAGPGSAAVRSLGGSAAAPIGDGARPQRHIEEAKGRFGGG